MLNKKFNKTKKPYKSLTKLVEEVLVSEYATVLIQKDTDQNVMQFKVSNQTADKVIQALDVDPHYEKIDKYLNSKGFTVERFQRGDYEKLMRIILDNKKDSLDAFVKFIETPNKPLMESQLSGNLIKIGNSSGLSNEFINSIFNPGLSDNKNNKVGPGEVLIGILFNDVRNTPTTGDLLVGNQEVEVKSKDGRFGPQPGRGEFIVPFTSFIAPFVNLKDPQVINNYNNIANSIKVPGVNEEKAKYDMIKHMLASYMFINDKKAVYENIITVLDSIYTSNNSVARSYITQAMLENKERDKLKKGLLKINTVGYLGDKKLIMLNTNLDYTFVTKEKMLEEGGLIDSGKIIPTSNFKFTDAFPNLGLK